MKGFRISFTGAQGTGKSTLARALVDELRNTGLPSVEGYFGVGDEAVLQGLPMGEHASVPAIRAVVHLHQTRETAADESVAGQAQIFDRCLLDCLAYADVLGGLAVDELKTLEQATQRSCTSLRLLLHMRVTNDYPVLNPRDESPPFRRAIEGAIERRALQLGLPLLPLAPRPDDVLSTARALARSLVPPGWLP